jgi:muramidase (phage lysozyme)
MMTADQATSTGQYQSGKYMWDPETKSWKVKMLSPETQKENKEEV